MIKIGAVDIDTSHPLAFGALMEASGRGKYTAVYNEGFRGEDEVEGFMKKFNIEQKYSDLSELAGSVDIGFIHSCNWDKHASHAKHFIEAGKPVFIDKPIAGNPADLAFLEEAEKGGAVILGSSSARYAEEIEDFNSKCPDEAGEILNVFGTCGVDEFNYGVHIVEAIGGILGTGAVSTRFCGRAERDGKKCETFFIEYAGGESAVYNNFTGSWQPFDLTVMTGSATHNFRIDTKKIYGALLDRIFNYMETGKNELAPVSELAESVRVMLAGKISRESGGNPVSLSAIPEDYAGFDGGKFEREYSGKAKKIFVKE